MPDVIGTLNADEFIRRYLAGESLAKIAASAHTDFRTAKRNLIGRGIHIRTQTESLRLHIDEAAILVQWESTPTLSVVAKTLCHSVGVVKDVLSRNGIPIPTSGDQNRRRWLMADEAARQRNRDVMANARALVRPFSPETLHARAVTREMRGTHQSSVEGELIEMLRDRGIENIIPQKAVGPYNIDIAVGTVAVEVLAAFRHGVPSRWSFFCQRAKYLFDNGWSILGVWHHSTAHPLLEAGGDQVHALLQEASRNPPLAGQYWMIRGDGQFTAVGRHEGDDIPAIPSTKRPLGAG